MTSTPDKSKPADGSSAAKPEKKRVRTHTPRPDELSQEVFEFIAAVDEYKRRNMRSFLEDHEVLEILLELGYIRTGFETIVTDTQLDDFAEARQKYRDDEGRLFPTWSEVFELLTQLGYARAEDDSAA